MTSYRTTVSIPTKLYLRLLRERDKGKCINLSRITQQALREHLRDGTDPRTPLSEYRVYELVDELSRRLGSGA